MKEQHGQTLVRRYITSRWTNNMVHWEWVSSMDGLVKRKTVIHVGNYVFSWLNLFKQPSRCKKIWRTHLYNSLQPRRMRNYIALTYNWMSKHGVTCHPSCKIHDCHCTVKSSKRSTDLGKIWRFWQCRVSSKHNAALKTYFVTLESALINRLEKILAQLFIRAAESVPKLLENFTNFKF